MRHFVPSETPAEGLGVMLLFELIDAAVPAFFRTDRPIQIARAPGRLDVLGGAAGHGDALVLQLPTAEGACAAVQLRDDTLVRLWSPVRDGSRTQLLSMQLGDLGLPDAAIGYDEARALFGADPRDHWAAHLLGCLLVLARERAVTFSRGAEVLVHSDVPEGVGAGASAAIEVATMRALASAFGVALTPRELMQLCRVVDRECAGGRGGTGAQATAVFGEADELLAVRHEPWQLVDSLDVPSDLEFVGLTNGMRRTAPAVVPPIGEQGRAEQFLTLLQGQLTGARRVELGDLLFDAHAARTAGGLGDPAADFLVERVRERRAAGAEVYGGKAMGGGGAVVLLGARGKVWYEALRIKKALLDHSGHSAHIFRWSSPGAQSFGGIELRPSGA